jgi:uncharacterized protein
MIQINVSQLLKEPVGSQRDYRLNDRVNIMENGGSNTVTGDVRLVRTNRSILVKAEFETAVDLVCARCLEAFGCPLKVRFEEEYLPVSDIAGFAPLPEDEEETGSFTIENNRFIDLTEAIRQYSLLALPMKPLCSQDCQGI